MAGRGQSRCASIRRILRAQECDSRLQHLPPGLAARQPVVFLLERHQFNVLLLLFQRIEHDLTLLKWHHGVVAPVDEEYRYSDAIEMFDGRNRIQYGIRAARDAPETIPVTSYVTRVLPTPAFPSQHPRQVGNPGHRDRAAIDIRIQRYTCKSRVAAIAGSDDTDFCRVDNAFLDQVANAVG